MKTLLITALALAIFGAAPAQSVAPAPGSSVVVVPEDDDYTQLTVSGENGSLILVLRDGKEATALVDGQVLTADRIVIEGDHLRIVGEDEQTLFDVRVMPDGGLMYPYGENGRLYASALGKDSFYRVGGRKKIGVTTEPVGGVVSWQLGLEPEEAFVITSVSEDMPASEAGLETHDIVIAINGRSPANVELLREAIAETDEGDGRLQLRVLRRGDEQTLSVGVRSVDDVPSGYSVWADAADVPYAPWLASPPEAPEPPIAPEPAQFWREFGLQAMDSQRHNLEQAEQNLLLLREQMAKRDVEARDVADEADALRHQAEDMAAVETAMQRLQDATALIQARGVTRATDVGIIEGQGGGRTLVVPTAPRVVRSSTQGVSEDRFARLESRLERLEELLERLLESGGNR